MKTIKKIVLKNTLGISELTLEPGQVNIISGKKGTGKTSVLDAINTALSNKNVRTDFIKQGELEASMYIELSDGTIIDRKKNRVKSDKIEVKNDGIIGGPETYLKELFNDTQFRPISFVEASTKEQNKILLSLIDMPFTNHQVEEWFGEVPDWFDLDQHLLTVLDTIQSKRGKYYLTREEINRDIKSKKSIAEDILKNVPEGYDAEKWRTTQLSEVYGELSKAIDHNKKIEDRAHAIENRDIEATKVKQEFGQKILDRKEKLATYQEEKRKEYASIQERIKMLEQELSNIELKAEEEKQRAQNDIDVYRLEESKQVGEIDRKAKELSGTNLEPPIDIEPIKEKAEHAEKMKAFLNEYDNAMRIHTEVEELQRKSNELTQKIEKARELPTELLKQADSPVEGLSVADGVPLINGLPIQNLSTGEQLELAVEIAKQLSGELGVILVDKLESLDTESQLKFIETCEKSGLQFFMTKVSDSEYDIVKFGE